MPEEYAADAVMIGTEREQLTAFLADNRGEVVELLDGLTEEQARRSLVPSRTTLLGLVKHAAFVERVWFHVALDGQSREALGMPDAIDDTFVLTDADTIATVAADYRKAWAEADQIASSYTLDDLAQHNRRSPMTLRWVIAHMIEELARHAGHGDILREQILAADAQS
jgi:uncharacterized damage-inducible protein DinB